MRIAFDLEQLMRGFLWYQGDMKKGKAKVAWDSICKPKEEGGLGNLYGSSGFIHISFMVRFPELFHMQVPMIKSDREDVIIWRDRDDIFSAFSVACAWESIRLRADVVPWFFKEAASLGSIAPVVLLLVSWDACLVSRIFLAGVSQCSFYS
nr:reverse transcriptase domain, reverse transcriptase zinc-binding domain protein [Tanacetum cinerariifolium]